MTGSPGTWMGQGMCTCMWVSVCVCVCVCVCVGVWWVQFSFEGFHVCHFGLLFLIHKCLKQCPAQRKHAKSSCWVHGDRLWAKSRGRYAAFPNDCFCSSDFFHSKCLNICIFGLISFFFPLSLIKIYTQNFRLHYFLNHHHLKILTDRILFPSPRHLHCDREGDFKSKPSPQQWPGGGIPSTGHSSLLGASWEKVVPSVSSLHSSTFNATQAPTCNSPSRS